MASSEPSYKYRFVLPGEIEEHLVDGWEPIPDVPVVYWETENLRNTLAIQRAGVFLRKELDRV